MNARQLGAQGWSEARRRKDMKEAEADFRLWVPWLAGVFGAVLILLGVSYGS